MKKFPEMSMNLAGAKGGIATQYQTYCAFFDKSTKIDTHIDWYPMDMEVLPSVPTVCEKRHDNV